MSWNIAHGRGRAFHQLLAATPRIERNLQRMGAAIAAQEADLIALQEVDAASWWSGGLDQLEHLRRADPPWQSTHGLLADDLGLRYGTAILSRMPLSDTRSLVWAAGWYAPAKGATIARVQLNGARAITFVSLHLHFVASVRRERQLKQLIACLASAPRPLVLAGDFNGGWVEGTGVVARIAEALDLRCPDPETLSATHPATGTTIDWILWSAPLECVGARVLANDLSDHRPVVVDLRWPECTHSRPAQP
ncbi:MAG: endonuclease/exonuclease/phosphatase family protein [Planctomycetota bacterium]